MHGVLGYPAPPLPQREEPSRSKSSPFIAPSSLLVDGLFRAIVFAQPWSLFRLCTSESSDLCGEILDFLYFDHNEQFNPGLPRVTRPLRALASLSPSP